MMITLAACGGKAIGPDDGGDDSGPFGRGGDAGDGSNNYVNPHCPDAGTPPNEITCDVFTNVGCDPGFACSPAVVPPQGPCEPETYGSFCFQEGTGTQGATCGSSIGCAAGYVCLITGTDTQCARMCALDGSNGHTCPDGFVCQPIDVPGFSACL